jgi:hypothetical protein
MRDRDVSSSCRLGAFDHFDLHIPHRTPLAIMASEPPVRSKIEYVIFDMDGIPTPWKLLQAVVLILHSRVDD